MAQEAMAHAVGPYTFGIIQNDRHGDEGRDIGTGIGILWKESFLILTAAHVLRETPDDELYYLLPPVEGLKTSEHAADGDWRNSSFRQRVRLDNPRILLSDDEVNDDLAAVVLPPQGAPACETSFYTLDQNHLTPKEGCPVLFLGYAVSCATKIGTNYAARLYAASGELCGVPNDTGYDPLAHLTIEYPWASEFDPKGLSGSGLWYSDGSSSALVWSPSLRLAGLLTHYFDDRQILRGHRVETVIDFLRSKEDWLRD